MEIGKVFHLLALVIVNGSFVSLAKPALSQKHKIITNPQNNHRYLLSPPMTWVEANNFARSMGGYLVTINDRRENQWLVDNFIKKETKFLWIGINDRHQEGKFCWLSDQQPDYLNWTAGEPNDNPQQGGEDFGAINGFANPFNRPVGQWSDAPKQAKLQGIIEIP